MRESGILMHITSLPSPYGIGTMGRQAQEFVDFLEQAGQSLWQILPLTPTGYGDSPYQSCCSFAGNPYLIDPDMLVAEGLLTKEECDAPQWGGDPEKADFGKLYNNRWKLLRQAYGRFTAGSEYEAFQTKNSHWLSDYALYMALKEKNNGAAWYTWEKELKYRQPDAIWKARQENKQDIDFYRFVQYLFYKQWTALKAYANKKGVRIIGDVPIYVPLDSVEVWESPDQFQLDETLTPTAVAGCPPDTFSQDGQLWGNPLYRWDEMAKNGYSWWLRRLAAAGAWYDAVRIDHFRGLESYWAVPYGDTTAQNGQWLPGPGMDFITAVKRYLPDTPMIAEDLGFLTPEVLRLREESGYPGMKVLGFAFDSREPSEYLPYNHVKNSVCYTGTHDNMTTRQWFDTASEDAVCYAREYMHLQKDALVWGMIRTAMESVADTVIIPMQDYLELGAEARMNFPGTSDGGNWTWRAKSNYISKELAEKICRMTRLYGRLSNKNGEKL